MMDFPSHAIALYLTHNEHKTCYATVRDEINNERHGYTDDCWISPEQRQKAIESNECWTMQWYPKTPVGFMIMSAADLDMLLAAAKNEEGKL